MELRVLKEEMEKWSGINTKEQDYLIYLQARWQEGYRREISPYLGGITREAVPSGEGWVSAAAKRGQEKMKRTVSTC